MNSIFNDPGFWHRLQFGFTIVYHYLFPQLTMGLAWFLVYWKWRALRTGDEKYNQAVRFWAKIFALNFAVGVVTGIPMEFQFGTNWAGFSKYAGGVIGQTLAMEGMFAFFLESAFIGALIFGERRLGPRYRPHTAACSSARRAAAIPLRKSPACGRPENANAHGEDEARRSLGRSPEATPASASYLW